MVTGGLCHLEPILRHDDSKGELFRRSANNKKSAHKIWFIDGKTGKKSAKPSAADEYGGSASKRKCPLSAVQRTSW